MKIYKSIILILFIFSFNLLSAQKEDSTKLSKYEEIFKDKKAKSVKGIVTLHQIEDKVYFEYPLNLFDREFIMANTVELVSDIGEAFVGQQPSKPLYLKFTIVDSTVLLVVKENYNMLSGGEESIQKALEVNSIPAIFHTFKILAYNIDSSAVLFDATQFLIGDYEKLRPFDPAGSNSFGGLVVRKANYVANRSTIGDIGSYSDNFSISTFCSYNITSSLFGVLVLQKDKPYTAVAKKSFLLLPEKPYRPRLADKRIGLSYEKYSDFSSKEDGVQKKYYAKRWRLEPRSDSLPNIAHPVKPKKEIVFYIDDKFPTEWFGPIKRGVERWNSAFEAIGFKDALLALPFPKNDPEFDPNNIKYNCIRYIPINQERATYSFWIDPRSGEILNADIYIYHDIASQIALQRFIECAASDKSVRGVTLPQEIMAESLEQIVAKQVGYSLGLSKNLAGSSSIPVDSLRSPTFTTKYGITWSIMDEINYNYVAQPGDKERGVKFAQSSLGPYDYYAIKWLYKPIDPLLDLREEKSLLESWIDEKMGDSKYRYGKENRYSKYDPSALAFDLGDDAIKASRYGIENLKTIIQNMNSWLKEEDLDFKFRSKLYSRIVETFINYSNHVASNIGGIFINQKREGDWFDHLTPVPKERQREALIYLLELYEHLSWLDNETEKAEIELMASISDYCRALFLPSLFARINDMEYSAYLSENAYTIGDAYEDIYTAIFTKTLNGESLSAGTKALQENFINSLLVESKLVKEDMRRIMLFGAQNSFNEVAKFNMKSENRESIAYGNIQKIKATLDKASKSRKSVDKDYYKLQLLKIEKALKIE